MQFTIGRFVFASKGAALKAVQKVLNEVPLGVALEGDQFELIRELACMHSQANVKIGIGINAITVQMNKIELLPPKRGFWIHRIDGTSTDFSIYNPFEIEKQRLKNNISWAARHAVRMVINNKKKEYFGNQEVAACQISGRMLSWDDAVVDHYGEWKFEKIISTWFLLNPSVKLIERNFGHEFLVADAESFLKFHNERAKLRVICKKLNMSLGGRS